jgi:addiction module RelE/StbE family toxin
MRKLVFSSSFNRAFKGLIREKRGIESKIAEKLKLLETDPFHPSLKTHKLKGKLSGVWACTVEYDCRIVFNLVKNSDFQEDEIYLIDIGSHDEVY